VTFSERKQERTAHFERFEKGWKSVRCVACAGTGRYDHNGSPKCGACNGTGRTKEKP
jgi:DnaJ-class molecular chaperone